MIMMDSDLQQEFGEYSMPEVSDPDELIRALLSRGEYARIDFGKMDRAIKANPDLDRSRLASVLQFLIECECLDYFRNSAPVEDRKERLHDLLNQYAA